MADRRKTPNPLRHSSRTAVPIRPHDLDSGRKPRPPPASLLGLPAELRNRIYEYLLCGNLIHVSTRPCEQQDPRAWFPDSPLDTQIPCAKQSVQWTHTLCCRPQTWTQSYLLSQLPEQIPKEYYTASGALNIYAASDDVIVRDHDAAHNACQWVQNDFRDEKYHVACSHFHPLTHKQHNCPEVQAYQERMVRKYGPPRTGLKILHRNAKLYLDILHVCRQSHKEAAMLPYFGNTFHFDWPSLLHSFVSRALTPQQAGCIRAIQIGAWPLRDVRQAVRLLRGLEELQLWIPWTISKHDVNRKEDTHLLEDPNVSFPIVDTVQVIVGNDIKAPSASANRFVRRKRAEDLERLFQQGMSPLERGRILGSR